MTMVVPAAERTLALLKQSEALLEGHFLLSSGRYAERYVQCAQLLQHPQMAAEVCQLLAGQIRAQRDHQVPYDVVIGPAMGAVTLAYEMARALGTRGLFAERSDAGGFDLRRGFRIEAGERVLVAEDVVTTGKSVGEVLDMLRGLGVQDMAVASLVNRSGGDNPFGAVPYYRLLDLDIPSWDPSELPADHSGLAQAVKPGSRPAS